jgi:hypothetical protein
LPTCPQRPHNPLPDRGDIVMFEPYRRRGPLAFEHQQLAEALAREGGAQFERHDELVEAPRNVIIIDQEPEQSLGGQALWPLAGIFLVDSPEQRRMRIRDSYDLALEDWMGFPPVAGRVAFSQPG